MPKPHIKINYTPINQRLRSAGDNDGKSKHFCSSAVLCVIFTRQMVKTCVISLRVIDSPNARDQSMFSVFHTFSVEDQTIAGYIHATQA